MNPWAVMGGAALGVLKGRQDEKAYNDEAKVAAIQTRYSPWTGMKGQLGKRPNMLGSVMQGSLAGADLGQKIGDGAAAPEAPKAPAVGETEDDLDLAGGEAASPDDIGGLSDNQNEWGVPKKKPQQLVSSSPGSTYSMGRRS